MPDFIELTDHEAKQYDIFERFREKLITFRLLKLLSKSSIMLSEAISLDLNIENKDDLILLKTLSANKTNAFSQLANCNGAIHWSSYKVLKALKNLNLRGLS